LVGWSSAARLYDLSDSVPKQIKDFQLLMRQVPESGQKELIVAATRYREHLEVKSQLDAAETEAHAAVTKMVSDVAGFEKNLGRPIRVTSDNPPKYDVGEEPTYSWLPDRLAWWTSKEYRDKWNSWFAAKQACDRLNAQQVQLKELREKYRQTQRNVEACKQTIDDVIGSLRPSNVIAGDQALPVLDATIYWSDLQLRKAWTTGAKVAFGLLDIPTLVSCMAMTAVAASRFLLAVGWLGQTQITK